MLKIALLQLTPKDSLSENLEKGILACQKAHQMGADMPCFPKCGVMAIEFMTDWKAAWMAEAIPADSDFVNAFGKIAKELQMAIGITFLEAYRGGGRNTWFCLTGSATGRSLYAKVHTCDFGEEKYLTPGEDFYVTDLDTAAGNVRVGAMICYGWEFPESARILMLKGAELMLVPNACPMEINRLAQLRGRAFRKYGCHCNL